MPTETFFNLPQEKQQRILEAAKKEFSKKSLNEASIAQVIKDAGIPRGSFYQYFQDKEDLYYYYFHTIRKNSHQFLIQSIVQAQGDVFVGFDRFFSHLIPEIFAGEHALFYKNVFMNMDYHGFRRVAPNMDDSVMASQHEQRKREHKQEHQELMKVIDRSKLVVASDRELWLLLHMLMQTGFTSVADGYRRSNGGDYDIDTTLEIFKCKLNWLEKGARKEQ